MVVEVASSIFAGNSYSRPLRIGFGKFPSMAWPSLVVVALLVLTSPLLCGHVSAQTCNSFDVQQPTYTRDVHALQGLLAAWNTSTQDIATNLPGWSSMTDPCNDTIKWEGVICEFICSSYYIVIGLQVISSNVVGYLPPSIGDLTNLKILTITGNPGLSGTLPDELGNLTNLNILDIHDNGFNSLIPEQWKGLIYLQTLDMSGNQLSGPIPGWIGGMRQLQRLDLSRNQLNDSIPVALADDPTGLNNLTYVVQISLSDNLLTGLVPDLSNLRSLRSLNLSGNQFNGSLPSTLGNLKQLSVLDLSTNNFSGGIPTTMTTSLSSLRHIDIGKNFLSGSFPSALLALKSLQVGNFDHNDFSGTLNVTSATNTLQLLSLVKNSITALDPDPAQLPNTTVLLLGGNPFCRKQQSLSQAMVCRSSSTAIVTVIKDTTNRKWIAILGASAGILLLLIIGTSAATLRRMYRKMSSLKEIQQEFARQQVQPTLYSYSELRLATQDFHPRNKLGEGGFGVVYKGVLPDGTELAVKQLTKSQQGVAEFLNEVCAPHGGEASESGQAKGMLPEGESTDSGL